MEAVELGQPRCCMLGKCGGRVAVDDVPEEALQQVLQSQFRDLRRNPVRRAPGCLAHYVQGVGVLVLPQQL